MKRRHLFTNILLTTFGCTTLVIASAFLLSKLTAAAPTQVCSSDGVYCLDSIRPVGSSPAGNVTITLTGSGFPSLVNTTDYVQDGLVAHYDGINNTGLGDEEHSNVATTWADLKGNVDLTLRYPEAAGTTSYDGWYVIGYMFGPVVGGHRAHFSSNPDLLPENNLPASWPTGNASRTIETVWKTPDNFVPAAQTAFDYGSTACGTNYLGDLGLRYNGTSGIYAPVSNCDNQYGSGISTNYTRSVLSGIQAGNSTLADIVWGNNKVVSVQMTYDNTLPTKNQAMKASFNGIAVPSPTESRQVALNTNNREMVIGTRTQSWANDSSYGADGMPVSSVRIYDRVLTSSELAHNANVDQQRFISLPVIMVGSQPCTNVALISDEKIQCTVPASNLAGDGSGLVDISMNYRDETVTLENAFLYVTQPTNNAAPVLSSLTLPANASYVGGSTVIAGTVTDPDTQILDVRYKLDSAPVATSLLIDGKSAFSSLSSGGQSNFQSTGDITITPGNHTMYVWVCDGVACSNVISRSVIGSTAPTLTLTSPVKQTADNGATNVALGNGYVKAGNKLYISGTITDPDTQSWSVSYSLSASTTPGSWVVCRSASSTRMEDMVQHFGT